MAGTRLRKEAKWVVAFSALLAARWWVVNNVVVQTNKSQGRSRSLVCQIKSYKKQHSHIVSYWFCLRR